VPKKLKKNWYTYEAGRSTAAVAEGRQRCLADTMGRETLLNACTVTVVVRSKTATGRRCAHAELESANPTPVSAGPQLLADL
jgi:hypothetical protein